MFYRVVPITQLMAYEFAQVEADFLQLNKRALASVIPSGLNFEQFIDQLRQGHLALLCDSPATPLLIKEVDNNIGEVRWLLNEQAADVIEPAGQRAYILK